MTDERRVRRDGIHIDREVAEAVAIEEELDSNVVGPYRFPDPVRRRVPAMVYAALALTVTVVIDPVPALLPLALAVWHWLAAWPLQIEQEEAVTKGATAVDFTVGHASAAVSFKGLRARPEWSVILYSAAEPPDRRALVTLDGVSGAILGEAYVEQV